MERIACMAVAALMIAMPAMAEPLVFQEDFEDPDWFADPASPWTKEGAPHDEVLVVQFADGDDRLGEVSGSIGSNSGGLSFTYDGQPPNDVLYTGGANEEVYLDYHMIVPPSEYRFEVSLDQLIYWANFAAPDPQPYGQGQTYYLGNAADMAYHWDLTDPENPVPDGPWQGHSWTGAEDDTRLSEELWNGTCQDKPDLDPKVLGLAFDPNTNTLYGSETLTDQLITINTATGEMTPIGPLGFTDVQGLAFDPNTNTLYGSDIDADELITIDTATGEGTTVGSLGFGNVRGLAFDPPSNTLYGADTSADALITINTTTGQGTQVGPTGFNNIRGLAIDTPTLYGTDTTTDVLTTINTGTGQGTEIGPLGYDLVRGLAFDPNTSTLYGTDPDVDQLLTVDPASGAATPIAPLTGVLDPVPPVPVDCDTPGAVYGAVGAAANNGLWFHRTWTAHQDASESVVVTDRGDGNGEVIFRMTMRSKDNDTNQASHAMDNLVVTFTPGDATPPSVAQADPPQAGYVVELPQVSVTFSEPVVNVAAGDLTVDGSSATTVTGTGAGPYVFDGFTEPAGAPGTVVNIGLAAGSIQDGTGNPFAGDSWTYTLTSICDFDRDGDVDSADLTVLETCYSGPNGGVGGTSGDIPCSRADVDADEDVDLVDFATLQASFTEAS